MKKIIATVLVSISLSACVAGGVPANNGQALSSSEKVFVGTWSGNLPSGKPVRIVVAENGAVAYSFEGRPQTLKNVKLTASRLSTTVGTNGSTVTLAPNGAYVFTWGPTGEITRATLRKG